MMKSQVYQLFSSLSDKEVKELELWMTSFSKGKKELILLLKYLILMRNKGKAALQVNKKEIFAICYPNKEYRDVQMRQLMFQVLKEIQSFLALKKFQKTEIDQKLQLLDLYRNRNLDKLFIQTSKKIQENLARQPFRNAQYYDWKYVLLSEENSFIESKERTVTMKLQEIGDNLEISFIAKKLRQSCLAVSHQNVFKIEYNQGMLSQVLQYVETASLFEVPLIALYYHCYLGLTANEKTAWHFSKFKKLIVEHKNIFPSTEIRELYLIAINHCIRGINKGEKNYIREVFDLYKLGLEEGFLLDKKMLSRWTYRNVVSSGLKLEEFDWVENFINSYKINLETSCRNGTYHYCLSKFHYEKGELDTAMLLLQQANYDDLLSKLGAKILLVKIYYEIKEFDMLDYFLISFQAFIKRQKGIAYHKENHLNFVKLTKKILVKNLFDKNQKDSLLEEIKNTNPLTEKKWLLLQIQKFA